MQRVKWPQAKTGMTEVRLELPPWAVPTFVALMEAVIRDGKKLKKLKMKIVQH